MVNVTVQMAFPDPPERFFLVAKVSSYADDIYWFEYLYLFVAASPHPRPASLSVLALPPAEARCFCFRQVAQTVEHVFPHIYQVVPVYSQTAAIGS